MQEKGGLHLVPAPPSNLLQSDDLCRPKILPYRSTNPILSNTGRLEMLVWIEPVLDDSFGMLSNLQTPHLIVELEDYQHVHVMPNLPLSCHPNAHTDKVTIG